MPIQHKNIKKKCIGILEYKNTESLVYSKYCNTNCDERCEIHGNNRDLLINHFYINIQKMSVPKHLNFTNLYVIFRNGFVRINKKRK